MRRKIQRSMIVVIAATILLTMGLMTFVVYRQNVGLMEEEIRQEASYVCAAIEASGSGYFEELENLREGTRVTWIGADGDVLYDSARGQETMENHAGRPEVRSAFQKGEGQDIRRSDTVGQEMFYYAARLSDGSVLRVSRAMSSALGSALAILPAMAAVAVLMFLFAWRLSRRQVAKLIEPVNRLDLEHPLENDVYEELTPLLESMDKQNKEKEAIANMRKEFSANVSHELKTPLTSISGYAEIMMNGLVRPEDVRGFSERIYNEASRLIVLIEDIIRLSKLDEGGGEIEKEEVDLYELTREVCSRLSHKAEKHSVHVEVTGEPVTITGVRQVLKRDDLQHLRERHQVQPARRQRDRLGGEYTERRESHCDRHGDRDPGRPDRARLRAVLPGGQEPFPGDRRHGPWPVHRQARRAAPRRHHPCGQQAREGHKDGADILADIYVRPEGCCAGCGAAAFCCIYQMTPARAAGKNYAKFRHTQGREYGIMIARSAIQPGSRAALLRRDYTGNPRLGK